MRSKQHVSKVTNTTLKAAVERYEKLVSEDLKPLDEQRYQIIPGAFAERRKGAHRETKDGPYITRDELITLMQWKL